MIDSKAVVQAHNLFMTFKAENKNSADISAIVDLNMQIKKGELAALVGPDGAGKTTLLRLIAGLYKASSGSLHVLGFDIENILKLSKTVLVICHNVLDSMKT